MHTAFFDTQDAIVALLRTVVPAAISVGLSPAMPDEEHVWVGGETPTPVDRTYRQSGVVAADESFDVLVHVLVQYEDPEYRPARDRLKSVLDPICDAFSADPRLGGRLMLCVVATIQIEAALVDERTWQAMATLAVRCSAQVTRDG
jgi:hypothetical protein